jgi:hypothetical protein
MSKLASTDGKTHLGLPNGPSLCGISGPYHGYDYTVSVEPMDFLWAEPDGLASSRNEAITSMVDPRWCPVCRRAYLDEIIGQIEAWPSSKPGGSGPGDPADESELFATGLLPMAERLRMQANGGADPEPSEWVSITIAYLVKRLTEWNPSVRPERQKLDQAVRTIVVESIKECRGHEAEQRRVLQQAKAAATEILKTKMSEHF